MKRLIVLLMIALIPGYILAQSTPLTSLYDEYNTKSGYKSTEIKPNSMSFEWEKSTEFPQFKEMMKNIESIRILKYQPEHDRCGKEKLWKKIMKAASDNLYKEVVAVNDDKTLVRLYMIKGDDGITKEAALAVKDKDGVILATMSGHLDFSALFSEENMKAMREMGKHFFEQRAACCHGNKE